MINNVSKFKVGDKIISAKRDRYTITVAGWVGVVTSINNRGIYDLGVKGPGYDAYVESKDFELVKEFTFDKLYLRLKCS